MPRKPIQQSAGKLPTRAQFRQRFDQLDLRREKLVARLSMLGGATRAHPGYRRAMTLLNNTFRKSSLAQRLGVLQAASWLIDLLEKLTIVG